MRCETWREVLSARLDGEEDPARRGAVDAHLAGCADCRTWYEQAALLTMRARLAVAEPVTDRTAEILAAVRPQPAPRARAMVALRGALGVLGAVQVLLGAAQVAALAGAPHPGHGTVGAASADHLWHESASWNAAVGAGLLWVAARRQRIAAVLPILGAFVAVLTLLSAADVAAGRVQWSRLASHAVVVLALAVAALINRIDSDPRAPRSNGSRWRLTVDDQPSPPARLRLIPGGGTTLHAALRGRSALSHRGGELFRPVGRLPERIRGVAALGAASRRMRTTVVRGSARTGVLAGGAIAGLLLAAGPASAHVEVSADKPTAGATRSVLTFVAESESPTAGITGLRVVLPAGIAPGDVTWVSGPAQWTLKPGADGYTVSGPAVKAGKDAEYAVRVRQLPADARQLVFKTLQTYSDGRVDRWIEEPPAAGGAEPADPAPVLTVAAAPAAPSSPSAASTPSAAPTTAAAPASDASSAAAPDTATDEQDSGNTARIWLLVAVAVAVVAGGLWWLLRRRRV